MNLQYHTGPIKSGAGLHVMSAQLDGFNTTLVQLKAELGQLILYRVLSFQYHTGPIKSLILSAKEIASLCFNTTLVQLKGDQCLYELAKQRKRFNTTLVQLKVQSSATQEKLLTLFQYHTGPIKSSLDESPTRSRRTKFQYHTGPIKSPNISIEPQTPHVVSIPHWSN